MDKGNEPSRQAEMGQRVWEDYKGNYMAHK